MSWTDVFPVFTDEMVEEFEAEATAEERAELEEWYGVEGVHNSQPDCREVVSFSLFWKNVRAEDPELPVPSREVMQRAQERGLAMRFNPWEHYVEPFLDHVPRLREGFPGVAFRIYLANDLRFLLEDLTGAGCEVHLMKSSSIRFAPGGLWRFLPFEEEGKLVTVVDVDRLNDLEGDLVRSRAMERAGVAAWRVPVPTDLTGDYRVCYLPFMGCQFGVVGGELEVRRLLDAFTWQARSGGVDHMVMFPNCGPVPIHQHEWPSYGFDEFFMTVAAYPRLAQGGMLTFVPATARSQLLSIDVEYVTWGNGQSELIYFPAGTCCGGAPVEEAPPVRERSVVAFSMADAEEGEVEESAEVTWMFLTRGEVHHPEIWEEYLGGEGGRVFAHVKSPEELGADGFLAKAQAVGAEETAWGDVSLVRATLRLLQAAVEGSVATHFALVSESCVPVRPLNELLRVLRLDPRSRLRATPWAEMRIRQLLKAQRGENLPGIRKELVHFQDQWMILSRADAGLILERDWTSAFASAPFADEMYFATVLALAGRAPLQHVANRAVTWTDWEGSTKHPREFWEVPPRLAARIAESGTFFARKFARGSAIGQYGMHLERSLREMAS